MNPFMLLESSDAVLTGGESAAFLIICGIIGLVALWRLSCVMWGGEGRE